MDAATFTTAAPPTSAAAGVCKPSFAIFISNTTNEVDGIYFRRWIDAGRTSGWVGLAGAGPSRRQQAIIVEDLRIYFEVGGFVEVRSGEKGGVRSGLIAII